MDIPIIEAEKLFMLNHWVYLVFAWSRWRVHPDEIRIDASMHADLLEMQVLFDTVTFGDHSHESDQLFVIFYLLSFIILDCEGHKKISVQI